MQLTFLRKLQDNRSAYLEEAPAAVGQAAGGHVVFLSTRPSPAGTWGCLRLGQQRLQGPELSCGSENTLQLWRNQRKFHLWPQPVFWRCWSAGMLSLRLSPLSYYCLHIHLSFSFHFSASSLSLCPLSPHPMPLHLR